MFWVTADCVSAVFRQTKTKNAAELSTKTALIHRVIHNYHIFAHIRLEQRGQNKTKYPARGRRRLYLFKIPKIKRKEGLKMALSAPEKEDYTRAHAHA